MTLDCQCMTAVLNQARTSGTNAVLGLEKAMLPGLQVSWRPGRMRFCGRVGTRKAILPVRLPADRPGGKAF